jgi:glycosyltransferase involved in cell wall biosynthesis
LLRSLHTIHSLDNRLGGAVHAGLNVCKHLVHAGEPVEVFATQGPQDDLGYLQTVYRDVPCHLVPRRAPARWYNGEDLSGWFAAHLPRFDVVELHAVFSFVTIRAAQACRRLRKPYLLRPHGSLDPFDLSKRGTLKRILGPVFLRPVLAGSAGVMCTSQREADLVETYGAKPARFVVPLPVPRLEGDPGGREAFRAKHGIPGDAFVVLFLSRIDYKKGLEFLLPALAAARREHQDVWFVLAGGGEAAFVDGIRRRIVELGLTGCTREVGFVSGPEKAAAFQAADLFALPSLNENFGIVIVEAMQAGRPVLISDQVYIHPEIIAAGAGVLCRPDPGDCERALRTVLADRRAAQAMGERAAVLAAARFSPEAATRQLLGVYEQICRREGP